MYNADTCIMAHLLVLSLHGSERKGLWGKMVVFFSKLNLLSLIGKSNDQRLNKDDGVAGFALRRYVGWPYGQERIRRS